jgi:two-component system cell cycle sensor histidine kinase/response regulator CckA
MAVSRFWTERRRVFTWLSPGPDLRSLLQRVAPRVWVLVAGSVAGFALAWLAADPLLRQSALVAGATLAMLAVVIRLALARALSRERRLEGQLTALLAQDAAPCFTTDEVGAIGFRNQAALDRFGMSAATLGAALADHFANPGAVLYRLQARAANQGAAREDVVTRRGHLRLAVHQVVEGRFLWRLEEFVDRAGSGAARGGAEGMSLPMLVASKAGVILFCNEAMRRLAGTRPKRLDRLFTTDRFRSGEEVEVAGAGGPLRCIVAEVDGAGERREIYLLPLADRPDAARVMADFEHVPVALMTFRTDGACRAANRAARELLGLAEDARPRLQELFDGPGRAVGDWLADIADGRIPVAVEVLRLLTAPGEVYHQVSLRRIEDGGRVEVLAVMQDATALKALEAQFTQSQKMQAIGQLAGGIAHDFNNLLTAISGHCDLLLLRNAPADPDYADLVQIHQNANRAAGLVGQLLAFSRKQTLRPERIDLQDVLSDMVHLLNRLVGEKVHLRLVHAPELGAIRADRRQLEQVVMNLVVNARDAMPDGGMIRVATEAVTLAEDLCRDRAVVPAGNYALIRVQDNGTGIAPEIIGKIFEPFFTTKGLGEGTGLGLSTVYGIVKQSGGFIFVDSVPGEGSEFRIYFPIHTGLPETAAAPAEAPPPRQRNRPGEGVVLLVEDEAPVRAFASRALRLRGWTVIEAESAEDALKALEDPEIEVDVFVTDVVMPGMDGPSWVREAQAKRPDVRVVFVSGYAEDVLPGSRDDIRNAVFLQKPFSLNDLAMTVQRQVH